MAIFRKRIKNVIFLCFLVNTCIKKYRNLIISRCSSSIYTLTRSVSVLVLVPAFWHFQLRYRFVAVSLPLTPDENNPSFNRFRVVSVTTSFLFAITAGDMVLICFTWYTQQMRVRCPDCLFSYISMLTEMQTTEKSSPK